MNAMQPLPKKMNFPLLMPKKVNFFNTNEAKEEAKNEAENGHEDKQRVDRATRLSHGYL